MGIFSPFFLHSLLSILCKYVKLKLGMNSEVIVVTLGCWNLPQLVDSRIDE